VTDNITLRRAVITHMRSELHALVCDADTDCGDSECDECEPLRPIRAAIAALDAALKADVNSGREMALLASTP
jgi:hypothetical protein